MLQHVVNAIVLGSILTVFAMGLSLAWGVLRILNLAHGVVATWGAIIAWLLTRDQDLPLVVVLVAVAVSCGVLNVVIDQLAFRRLRRTEGHDLEMRILLASVGVVTILLAVGEQVTKADTYSLPDGLAPTGAIDVADVRISALAVFTFVVSVVATAAIAVWLKRSRNGRALRAIAYDAETAGLMGIDNLSLTRLTMFISGVMAGLAGLLVSLTFHVVHAYMGEPLMLEAIVVIILGGIGSIPGAIVGAFIFAGIQTAAIASGHADWQDILAFSLVVLILLVRPAGIFGRQTAERQ